MRPRSLALSFTAYVVLLCVAAASVRAFIYLDPHRAPTSTRILSDWKRGQLMARVVVEGDDPEASAPCPASDCTRIVERIVDEGPLPMQPAWFFGCSIAAGRDGIAVKLDDRTIYFTPTDLLHEQVSRDGMKLGSFELRIGLDRPETLLSSIAAKLKLEPAELKTRARLRRFIVQREDAAARLWPVPDARADKLTVAMLDHSARMAADYLVRNQADEGKFVYQLDAVRGKESSGYNLPRHGGTTLFLAEVAAAFSDSKLTAAAIQAAKMAQTQHTLDCGADRCIGNGARVDAGSTALMLLAYVELARAGARDLVESDIRSLAKFLRGLQRPDGEFMHFYDRDNQRPVDFQVEYYTGEVVLALARAHRITGEPADLEAASKGLAYLTRRTVYQNRYNFGSEHWTCQALAELWARAPDRAALGFCLDYQTFNRQFQVGSGSEFGDFEGGIAPNPFAPPRVTSTGSRTEAAVATLAAALEAGTPLADLRDLNREIRGALAFMLRFQLNPGPRHLLFDPARVEGGMPGSPTDMRVRIDFLQHAASGALRYARLARQHPELLR